MTHAKKLKKAIRRRARKTGESYTAARKQVLDARRSATAAPAPPAAPPARAAARRATRTTSDTPVRKATGHGFDHWFAVLDAFGAAAKGHTASARHLREDHGVPGWHCQMITVEYERARGLRAANQSSRGEFQVAVSRTLPLPLDALRGVFEDARRRRRWLASVDAGLARALEAALGKGGFVAKPRHVQIRYAWGASRMLIAMEPRPGGKTLLLASSEKLAGPEDVERRRAAWSAALDALKSMLADGAGSAIRSREVNGSRR